MARSTCFQIHRVAVYILLTLSYIAATFHSHAYPILLEPISVRFNATESTLSVISSVYFWSSGLLQPFAGIFADHVPPQYLIGTASLFQCTGSLLIGFAKNLGMIAAGRLFTGFGAVLGNMSSLRFLMQWFSLKHNSILTGVYIGIGCLGAFLAQSPLGYYIEHYDWQSGLVWFGVATGVVTLFQYILIREVPSKWGYDNVEGAAQPNPKTSLQETFQHLWRDLKLIGRTKSFWFLVFFSMFMCGNGNAIIGLWISPFLTNIYNYSPSKLGNALLATSISQVVGNLIIPPISDFFKTRRYVFVVTSILSIIVDIVFASVRTIMPFGAVFALLFVLGLSQLGIVAILPVWTREILDPSVAMTAFGFINAAAFIGGAFFQLVFSWLRIPGESLDPMECYSYCTWTPGAILGVICTVLLFFIQDSTFQSGTEQSSAITPVDLPLLDDD